MFKSTDDKEKAILKEKKRLQKNFAQLDGKRKETTRGLIDQAAFMRASLDELAWDLNENGFVEWFAQGEHQEPYQRKRPQADLYNTMNTSYQKIIKQLTDLLPKEVVVPKDDGFDAFAGGREDL